MKEGQKGRKEGREEEAKTHVNISSQLTSV